MKRVFSFVLVLAMLLALSISVSAAAYEVEHLPNNILSSDPEEQGKITITNATAGKQYSVYKIFDADIADGKTASDSDGVTYTLEPDSAAFPILFGTGAEPVNPYFNYNPSDKRVSLKSTSTDGVALVKYFQGLIDNHPSAFPYLRETAETTTSSDGKEINEVELVFEGLQYGYYLIKGNNDAVATLNSAAPSMKVIDKNQAPGNVDKLVKKQGADDTTYNTTSNTANIGDVVTYKIEFNATNYSGQEKLRFYNVVDVKGTGIWAEFNSFMVSIDGEQKPGYYLNDGGLNTNNWASIGNWGTTPAANRDPSDADWFLVHTGFDTYSILIPWIEDYEVISKTELDANNCRVIDRVNIPTTGDFKYDSPVPVVITYNAAIEPNANIGGSSSSNANLFNEVTVTWQTDKGTQDSSNTDKVYSETFGLTILKEDMATADNLADAKFAVYKDAGKTQPLYVIPTGVDGVYMVDSKGTAAENVTGTYMETARDYFKFLRTPEGSYVKDSSDNNVENLALKELGSNQTNEVVTAENGRLVILGLDLGTYHFVETEAPDGYNKLQDPFSIDVTKENSNHNYYIYADKEGNVQTESDGADYTYIYALTNQPVQNSKGASLPSTGGEGRMMLISVGAMIAMAFAVLMITQKKMSVYKD